MTAYDRLLEHLEKLPGVGRRSAERIALHLLRAPGKETTELSKALAEFRTNLKVCRVTGHVSEADPCWIVTDPKREHSRILVVEQPSDVIAVEQTGSYRGSYHVLMGRLAPLDAIMPGDLNVDGLLARIQKGSDPVSLSKAEAGWYPPIEEVILGTNPTLEGDGTALYLAEKLDPLNVTVTRLPRGLPTGGSLQQVSKAVLADALASRR